MKKILFLFLAVMAHSAVFAYISPSKKKTKSPTNINLREDCLEGNEIATQNINNVRATLLSSGDVWWNLQQGQYFVPNTPPEIEDVSSIFAGAVWIGGYEPVEGGQDILKIAATTYRTQGGDFYPGPLNDETGTTEKEVCEQWDRFFRVTGTEIDQHRVNVINYRNQGVEYPKDSMPDNIRYYPGLGNTDFVLKYGFPLPDAGQGLASFYDDPNSAIDVYDPENGDYPKIDVRGCEEFVQYPDEMFFWIYNDQGGPHLGTQGQAIQMEVQVQAFAYESNDELNDMTFQRYKLINRAQTVIKDCYFAMWVDGDLGCSEDDYIGCDSARSMAILYNQDEIDGNPGSDCPGGVATYGGNVPVLGIDYFRGPLKPQIFGDDGELLELPNPFAEADTFVEIGMSSFVYTNRQGAGEHPPGTWDPETAEEHYRLLDGQWRDGLPITFGGSGYNIGSTDTIRYVLPGAPAQDNDWSMCTAGLGFGDRRTIQASGPFVLKQGAINELIIGVVWVPNQVYPCPELNNLNKADDLAQALFDNCFQTLDGPQGPDVDIVELDRQVIILLSNDTILSNNKFEEYSEVDIFATDSVAKALPDEDISYKFEGYLLYQLRTPNSASNLDDIENARLVRQVDVVNNVTTMYNWTSLVNPLPGNNELVYTPELEVVGSDNGIRHSFSLTEDAFSQGSPRLINHKEYYYFAVAYGYNEYEPFNPQTGVGQQRPFITGRRTFGVVTVVPRPIVYDALNTFYGDGPIVTRKQGVGNQGQFIELEDDMYDKILAGSTNGDVTYKEASSPLRINIVNPIDVRDGKFRLEINGEFDDDGRMEATDDSDWVLTDLENGAVFKSYGNLESVDERILRQYGFSINISREEDVSNEPEDDLQPGEFVGATLEYADPLNNQWLSFLPNGGPQGANVPFYNYLDQGQSNESDPAGSLRNTNGVNMLPLKLADFGGQIITPAMRQNTSIAGNVQSRLDLADLNNVDIVFTSDRSKWSKCIVVETSHVEFYDAAYDQEGDAVQLEMRSHPSVSRDQVDENGDPQEEGDGTVGFGWFPGYAVDVETGERLNIFFGENSTYGGEYSDLVGNIGRDMTWNPNSVLAVETPEGKDFSIWNFLTGGQHTIYVTRTEYDECQSLVEFYEEGSATNKKLRGLRWITWTGIPLVNPGNQLLSYQEGLIPNDVTIKLRVDNTFGEELDFVEDDFEPREGLNPIYEFEIRGKEAVPVDETTIDDALSNVNVVPNPYYGNSTYEVTQNDTRVKITNVPQVATISIYSLDGRFIAQFKRDAMRLGVNRATASVNFSQEEASVVWNLKNSAGIPVSSGVYLIHVLDEQTGAQKTIKWFGINRKFDPSGL